MTKTARINNARPRNMEELPTGRSRPSLCVAYFILSGIAGWALKQSSKSAVYALGAFGFLLVHSLIGFLCTTHPDPPDIIKKIYRQTALIAEIAPFALINTELYLISGMRLEFVYAHLVTAILPLLTQFGYEEHTNTAIDLSVMGNLASLLYLHVIKETGVWTGGMLALIGLNHFVFKSQAPKYNVPRVEVITIGLCFFTVFAMNCMKDVKG